MALAMRAGVPLVLQTEAAECGLACLAMVLGHFGVRTDLVALRQRHQVSMAGVTLGGLIGMAAQEQLGTRALRLEVDELSQLRLPCVLHWDLGHFVVLKSCDARSAVILDPARGERRVGHHELSAHFTGVALELWPAEGFRPRSERTRVSVRQLIGQIRGAPAIAVQLLTMSIALELFGLAHPQFMQWVTDQVLVSRDEPLLTVLALGFVLITVVEQGLALMRSWLLETISASVRLQWRSNVLRHLMHLPVTWFQKRHLGDVMSRFNAIDHIQQVLTTTFVEATLDGVMALFALVLMALYSPKLAAVAVASVLLYVLVQALLFKPLLRAREEEIVREATQSSHVLESLRGVRALKLFGRQAERLAHWQSLLAAELNAGLRVRSIQLLRGLARGLTSGLATIALLWLGAGDVLQGELTLGMLLAFIAYRTQFDTRMTDLVARLMDLRLLRLEAERLADIVLTPTELAEQGIHRLAHLPLGAARQVSFRQLRFRYADQEPFILDGIDLEIPEGQCIAIVGPSGCGKTTLINLLLGDLKPTSGDVLVAGVSLQRLGRTAWRGELAAVMQDDALFAGTMADNICFFDPEPDHALIEQAARLAAIWDDITAMPMGLQTLTGDMGTTLSGGQKQRILLARALYKRPRVLVLDEATSHLDVLREARVNAAIARMGITRIVVAHRPETVAAASRVVALQSGRIVFDGAPAEYLDRLRRTPP
ncbi:colicin V processing peptidase [Sphaerotilus hippei]|uniref:Cyclolysin secretion/processing ATP-binding protein CyaB n=2 Tax=Sphaerotilus hippei TaxID=744406 RepID=A0A318GXH6_9BURK|nr:colicin V processing peptidase [Sphaerotilus hippei]